jgi:nickel-dependent lactate racemase
MPEDLNFQQDPNRGLNFIKINHFPLKMVLNSRNMNVSVFHGDISVAKYKSRVREGLP